MQSFLLLRFILLLLCFLLWHCSIPNDACFRSSLSLICLALPCQFVCILAFMAQCFTLSFRSFCLLKVAHLCQLYFALGSRFLFDSALLVTSLSLSSFISFTFLSYHPPLESAWAYCPARSWGSFLFLSLLSCII